MSTNAIARRYAAALFEIASERQMVDLVDRELKQVVDLIAQTPDLKRALEHQLVPPAKKQELVNAYFSGKVSQLTLNFLNVLATKRREGFVAQIYEEYLGFANRARGIVEVEVRSAVGISEANLKSLEGALARRLAKKIVMKSRTDPSLIGGAIVRIGDQLLDGSVRTRLLRLKERLFRPNVSK